MPFNGGGGEIFVHIRMIYLEILCIRYMFRTGTVCFNKVLFGYAADAQGSCVSWKFVLGNFVSP